MSEQTALQTFSGIAQTSFGDRDAARTDQIPTYKATEKRKDRIAIIDASKLSVARTHAHFSDKKGEGLGYVICKSKYALKGGVEVPVEVAKCCEYLPDARKRCGTWIIRYACDPNTGRPLKPLDYTLMAWIFTGRTFENLFTINEEYTKDGVNGLELVDLVIDCEDTEYQKIKIIPSPNRIAAMEQFKKDHAQEVEDWVKAMAPRMAKALGREVTDQQILAVAGGGASSSGGPAPDVNVKPQSAPSDMDDLFA